MQTDDGRLIRGYRVPENYRGGQECVVEHGSPVRWRTWDGPIGSGTVVFDWDGRQLTYESANGKSRATFGRPASVEIEQVEPPPLLPPLARRPNPP